jgi:hypothetical protein
VPAISVGVHATPIVAAGNDGSEASAPHTTGAGPGRDPLASAKGILFVSTPTGPPGIGSQPPSLTSENVAPAQCVWPNSTTSVAWVHGLAGALSHAHVQLVPAIEGACVSIAGLPQPLGHEADADGANETTCQPEAGLGTHVPPRAAQSIEPEDAELLVAAVDPVTELPVVAGCEDPPTPEPASDKPPV